MELDIDFIRNEWVPALRNGEYDQALFKLHTSVGYCCLGVAADLCGVEWEIEDTDVFDNLVFSYTDSNGEIYTGGLGGSIAERIGIIGSTNIAIPPGYVEDLLGDAVPLQASYGINTDEYREGWRSVSLSTLNDQYRWSFEQIADFLEAVCDAHEEYKNGSEAEFQG